MAIDNNPAIHSSKKIEVISKTVNIKIKGNT